MLTICFEGGVFSRGCSSRDLIGPNLPKKGVGKGRIVLYLPQVKPVRIYRRRWVGALFFVAIASSVLYASTWASAEQPPIPYTVAPGDTLWSIAVEHYPSSKDPRVAVGAIRLANEMEGHRIYPGQRLELPLAEP